MKNQYSLETIIYKFQQEICYYNQIQLLSTCPYEKAYCGNLIKVRTQQLINLMRDSLSKANEKVRDFEREREFTLEELSTFDGSSGRAAYVAVNGTVYDISKEATWGGGTHFGVSAGKDLSAEFMGCHKGIVETLNKLPKVGVLKK